MLSLADLRAQLRPEQEAAVKAAVDHLTACLAENRRGHEASLLLVSPTGTGKSYIQGCVHRTIRESSARPVNMISTFPASEIAEAVFLKTYGDSADPIRLRDMSAAKRQAWLESHGFWTIKRLHNELVKGNIPMPDCLQHDEAHHSTDDTHELVHGVCGLCPRVGSTATDYRGIATETAKFRERWPRQHRVLTLKNAVLLGRLSMPTWNVWPLIDDEMIDVKSGEFVVSKVESAIKEKLGDLVDRLRPFWCKTLNPLIDRPTMVAVPGVEAVKQVVAALNAVGMRAVGVTGETSDADRAKAFAQCVGRTAILVQIRVVGEGVDLPIRRLIDLAPTVSPVLWMQRVGRITRPVGEGEAPPEYIACCHNLARHAYLWHGVMPSGAVRDATKAWGDDWKPSRRFLARAVDVEGLGRFEPAAIPFADGSLGTMYVMQTKDGLNQYAVVLHPLVPDPWFFSRSFPLTGNMVTREVKPGVVVTFAEKNYDAPEAKWRRVAKLPELRGCHSIKPGVLTPAQSDWWKECAERKGLDPNAEITIREFQILPILQNSRVRLEV